MRRDNLRCPREPRAKGRVHTCIVDAAIPPFCFVKESTPRPAKRGSVHSTDEIRVALHGDAVVGKPIADAVARQSDMSVGQFRYRRHRPRGLSRSSCRWREAHGRWAACGYWAPMCVVSFNTTPSFGRRALRRMYGTRLKRELLCSPGTAVAVHTLGLDRSVVL